MRLGIDIGTHVARAAILDPQKQPRLVRLPDGASGLPALARQTMHGLEVGAAARALVGNAETTVYGCTRLMGRADDLPARLLERLPYPVRAAGGEAVCDLLYAEVRASDVYGRIIRALVDVAAQSLGEPIEAVALTVPASAEDRFRVQARAAVEAQGIAVRRLINRPTAALLAASNEPWRTQRGRNTRRSNAAATTLSAIPQARYVAVVDCGGGSTDVSIAEQSQAGVRILATAGDILLGGDDLTWAVAQKLNQRFISVAGVDVFAVDDSRVAAQGLRAAAEDALQTLSVAPEALIVLDHGGGFGRDLVTVVRRQELVGWLAPLLARIGGLCTQALTASGSSPSRTTRQIEQVLVIGDAADLPGVRETVARAFGQPVAALCTADAALLAAYGAALAAADDAPSIWDVTPYSLGINCYYEDEELFSPIIAANTPIPTPAVGTPNAYTESYTTRYPDQTRVKLDILQYRGLRVAATAGADRVYPHECELLGSWDFGGLRPRKGRHAPFTVTFAIDADGILHLHAEETETGHHLTASVNRGIG